MSHFSVLVVTEGGTDEEVVDALRPFHEYECTGCKDEFVVEVDITLKARQDYENAPSHRVESWPDGEVTSKYDRRFYRTPTAEEAAKIGPLAGSGGGHGMIWRSCDWGDGKGYSTRVYDRPSHWVEKHDLLRKYMSFEAWVLQEYPEGEHYRITYNEDDTVDEVFEITNPHAKWDWYSVGGRWNGLLGGTNTRTLKEAMDIDFVTFAVLFPGGIWAARGDMGWWGTVSGEVAQWDSSFKKLLGSIRPDFYGTVVDCHI